MALLGNLRQKVRDGLKKKIEGLTKSINKEADIKFDEIEAFFEEHSPISKFDSKDSVLTLFSLFDDLKEVISELESANLRNPNVEKRALDIMNGNRGVYIRKINLFMDNFEKSDTDIDYLETLSTYSKIYFSIIEEFNSTSARAFYLLNEFFGDQMKKFGRVLKKIDDLFLKVKKDISLDPVLVKNKLNDLISELKQLDDKVESLNTDILNKENEIEEINKGVEIFNSKIEALKRSERFQELVSLQTKKEESQNIIKSHENSLLQVLSKLNPALKRYAYSALDEKPVIKLMENPLSQILNDGSSKIQNIFEGLKKSLEDGSLNMDKKTDSMLVVIDKLNVNYILEFKRVHELNFQKKRDIEKSILAKSVGREISEIEYNKDHLIGKKPHLVSQLELMKKNLERIDRNILINQIQETLSNYTSINVKIIVS